MSRITLQKDSIIYVLSPAYFKTGGTELLHQYVHVLKKNMFNAIIVYTSATNEKNINPAFGIYVDTYLDITEIIDDRKNVLIVPEIYTNYLKKYSNIKKVIWWESVDNYLKLVSPGYLYKNKHYKSLLYYFRDVLLRKNNHIRPRKLNQIDYHFVQSYYAFDYVEKKGVKNIYYVSDYINEIYTKNIKNDYSSEKDNIVCYNPSKGWKFTKKIIEKANNISFVPLVNMTNDQVMATLRKAKVYIDFGNHPGKDRFPREAAAMGCCIITGLKGSANFEKDVMIKECYKFEDKNKNIPEIITRINECLNNYDKVKEDFKPYVNMIEGEKDNFEKDVIDCYQIEGEE